LIGENGKVNILKGHHQRTYLYQLTLASFGSVKKNVFKNWHFWLISSHLGSRAWSPHTSSKEEHPRSILAKFDSTLSSGFEEDYKIQS